MKCEFCEKTVTNIYWILFYQINMSPIINEFKKQELPIPVICWKCYFTMPAGLILYWVIHAIKEIKKGC